MSGATKKSTWHLDEFQVAEDKHDYSLADEKITIASYKAKLKITVVSCKDNDLEFDMIGIHSSVANAFRRLMLSHVPSMAIEKVFLYKNTSILQDEVLAHRMGLLPLKANPYLFQYKDKDSDDLGTELDTLEFELKVKCTRKKDVKNTQNPDIAYENSNVFSGQMKWLPRGKQAQIFKEADVAAIYDNIVVTKLRPGQEVDLRCVAVKGVGIDHAKFSPVATAYYRLMPEIRITKPVKGKDACLLQQCFSPGVIGINEDDEAYVKDVRHDTLSRNVYRYPHLAEAVSISRVRDHFIFTVESIGALKPDVIFLEAVKMLRNKCIKFM
ncbi:DNA-directed RNA polymerases I and III subunit RPAC1-like, partial [Teleopsis dalmanni]|uniref:DNA-directed RNA polymerases I and III subunit RPAC1-like n=1 Tax=Teleopsis dalmanni TaxID=139649 RepID=UPI0018CE4EDE